ncbi:unnamed protein product [Cylicocyclus nassatus]|uniref:Uncharacterized protein n=1 Tax=Cylicocyclus nassatus TaxID=53992 RepID=A0AA36M329_CYLNA|nr:unnamed protein product [Cylicocyclus nassatus]
MSSIDEAGAVRNILPGYSNISSKLSLAMASLVSAVDQLKNQQDQLKEQHDALPKNWSWSGGCPEPTGCW